MLEGVCTNDESQNLRRNLVGFWFWMEWIKMNGWSMKIWMISYGKRKLLICFFFSNHIMQTSNQNYVNKRKKNGFELQKLITIVIWVSLVFSIFFFYFFLFSLTFLNLGKENLLIYFENIALNKLAFEPTTATSHKIAYHNVFLFSPFWWCCPLWVRVRLALA